MARNNHPEQTIQHIIDVAGELFIQKGYENTSIQDIINNLGGLSKGAVYHHFKSKKDIFDAVFMQIESHNTQYYSNILNDNSLNGLEKLKQMIRSVTTNPNNHITTALLKPIINDPLFLKMQIDEIVNCVAPQFFQPIIEQGIADGSIKTDYPKEIAEIILVIANIWISPLVMPCDAEGILRKIEFSRMLFIGIGLDIIEDDMVQAFADYCKLFNV